MLASGGYSWTVIAVGDRREYLAVLESASVDGDLARIAKLLAVRVAAASDDRPNKDEIDTAE